MNIGKRFLFLTTVIGSVAAPGAENSSAPEPGDLRAVDKIEFPISSSADVRPEFERGVALLHSFFYEEARRIFTAVVEKDRKCAMAQSGIAMTWWHPIWTAQTPEEMKLGMTTIDKATAMIRLRQGCGGTGRPPLKTECGLRQPPLQQCRVIWRERDDPSDA